MFWIPIGIGLLTAGAYYRHRRKKAELTPDRKIVYETALRTLKDSAKLRTLADAFAKVGLTEQADLLRKRAALRDLPADVKAARHDAYVKGMSSKDPVAVEKLAKSFADQGATGAAQSLLDYAKGLRLGKDVAGAQEYARSLREGKPIATIATPAPVAETPATPTPDAPEATAEGEFTTDPNGHRISGETSDVGGDLTVTIEHKAQNLG